MFKDISASTNIIQPTKYRIITYNYRIKAEKTIICENRQTFEIENTVYI